MAGALFSFSCPIDQIGDENGQCTWTVVCNDGEKINIKVPANEIKTIVYKKVQQFYQPLFMVYIMMYNKTVKLNVVMLILTH